MTGGSGRTIFVIGGARSGKSGFALTRASAYPGPKAYIATARALDDEMKERIEAHKLQRGADWDTHEEPLEVAEALKRIDGKYGAVIIDCLTLWLSNLMLAGSNAGKEIGSLLSTLDAQSSTLFVVSNEVGMGIVPDNELARKFRDMAGSLNQRIAELADEVYFVTAGIPVRVK